jgi:GT2 family glycosyltransferase
MDFIPMNKTEPKVIIVILNWNGYKDTIECIDSINRIRYNNYKIVVVDNGSNTNEIDNAIKLFPNIEIIKSENNLGFSGGNNLGIRSAFKNNAEFILLLNNDTIVEPDFLTRLIEKTSVSETIGILTPKILYFSNPDLIWSAGCKISKLRSSGFPLSYNKYKSYSNVDKYCTCATGCCMLIRRDVFNKIGFLDEKYFLYLEDTDYSYRAINAGFKIYYVSDSIIYHKVSSTTKKNNSYLPIYYSIRNRLYFSNKNFGLFYYSFSIYLIITLIVKIIYSRDRLSLFKIIKLAILDFYKGKMGYSQELQNCNSRLK